MTPDLQNLGLRWRQIRFNPLRSLTPERLAEALDSAAAGWLRQAALIYETIEQREAIVRSVMSKRRAAVARRDWQVVIPDPADPRGEAHKETLEYFYHNVTVTDATDLNVRSGMSGLLRQMMDCIIQKYAVHEIIWQPGPDGLTAELRRVPIYFFENRSGKLRFIGPETRADGVPLEDGGWMVTVADGLGEALAICYMYKRLAVQDWLAFSEKFSVPGILGRTSAKAGSPEGLAMRDSVLAYASEWQGVVYSDEGAIKDPIQVIQTPSGGSLPQQELATYMDKMISSLVRGGDLGTVSQHNSQGSNMQANETTALLEDDCALMSETLQTHLDRAIIRMVHGDEHPAAYIVINPPSDTDLAKDLVIDTGLLALGVNQDAADLAERYGREVKAESGAAILPAASPLPLANAAAAPPPARDTTAQDAMLAAMSADLQPLGKALAGALHEGDLPAMQAALKKISARMPEFLDSTELANYLAREMAGAYLGNEDLAGNGDHPGHEYRGNQHGKDRIPHPAIGKTGNWKSLGLEDSSAMPADPASSVSDVVRARVALERGIPSTDHLGNPVKFDKTLLAHWTAEGKPAGEQDRRLRRLADAVRTVKSPHEVWQNPATGHRTFLRKFQEDGGHFTVNGFMADKSGNVHSYFHDRRNTSIDKRRTGTLTHKR